LRVELHGPPAIIERIVGVDSGESPGARDWRDFGR